MVTKQSNELSTQLAEAIRDRSASRIDAAMGEVRLYQRTHERDINLGYIVSGAMTMREALASQESPERSSRPPLVGNAAP